MRRWTLRIFFSLLTVIFLAIVTVQIILLTGVPRNIAIRSLEKTLHLRVTVNSLSTGWFGHSTLHGVTFSLPLAEKPILKVDTLRVRHTWLVPMLFGTPITLRELDLDAPQLCLVNSTDGRLNVSEVIDAISANRTSGSASAATPPQFPAIRLSNGTLTIVDGDRQSEIGSVNFNGSPEGLLSWKFDLDIGHSISAVGRVAPGGNWEHESTLKFSKISQWAKPWMKLPADLSGQVHWLGRSTDGGFTGRLEITDLLADGYTAAGAIECAQTSEGFIARLAKVHVTTRFPAAHEITALGGELRYQNKLLRAQALQLRAYGGPATVSGYYDFAGQTGSLSAGWDQLSLPGKILHGGSLNAQVRCPFPDRFIFEGELLSYATTPQGPWRANISFGGQKENTGGFSLHATASHLVWNRRNPIVLDGLTAQANYQGAGSSPGVINLTALSLAEKNSLHGGGYWNLATGNWDFKVAGDRAPIQLLPDAQVGFNFAAGGNRSLITLHDFTLAQAQTTLSIAGSYRFGIPKPVAASITLISPARNYSQNQQQPIVQGALRGEAGIEGTFLPMALSLSGHLAGTNVHIANRDLADLAVHVSGELNTEHAQIQSERLSALGGEWAMRGTYDFANQLLDADVRVGKLPLENLAAATARTSAVRGTLDGEWDAYFPKFPLNLSNIRVLGQGWIHDLAVGELHADSIHFQTEMENGQLTLDPITLQSGSTGIGQGSLDWSLDHPDRLHGKASLSAWPIEHGNLTALVKLEVPDVVLTLPTSSASAHSKGSQASPLQVLAENISANVSLRSRADPIGEFSLVGGTDGQSVTIDDLHGTLLDAPLRGDAVISLSQPLQSDVSFHLDDLNLSKIARFVPAAQGLSGTLHCAGSLEPAQMLHPLEPLAVHLQASFDHGLYRSIPLKHLDINAFMNSDRIVLDDRPGHGSDISIASGNIGLWGRFGHPGPGLYSSQTDLQLHNLDFDQIVHAAMPDSKPTQGKLSGKIMLLYNTRSGEAPPGTPSDPTPLSPQMRKLIQTLYGEAHLDLSGSDMATLFLFSDLYTVGGLGSVKSGPIGSGSADVRLENGTLYATNAHYFNRGTDALLELTSPEIWNFPYNPRDGTLVGSIRPLAALKLPLVSDVQTALDALQSNFTSLQLSGTWKTPQTNPITFAKIGRAMRALLIGNIGNGNTTQNTSSPQ